MRVRRNRCCCVLVFLLRLCVCVRVRLFFCFLPLLSLSPCVCVCVCVCVLSLFRCYFLSVAFFLFFLLLLSLLFLVFLLYGPPAMNSVTNCIHFLQGVHKTAQVIHEGFVFFWGRALCRSLTARKMQGGIPLPCTNNYFPNT